MTAENDEVYFLSEEAQWDRAADGETICTISDTRVAMPSQDALALHFFATPSRVDDFLNHVARADRERERWTEFLKRLFVLRILVRSQSSTAGSRRAMIERANPDCDQLFFLFAGGFGGMGAAGTNIDFLRATQLWERNFVLFRDFSGTRYLSGISREIDSFRALLQWQERHRAGLPHAKRVFYLGNSMGAGTAVMCGHYLRAEAVYAFSLGWLRYERGVHEDPDHGWDLRALLEKHNGVTQYHVFYAAAFDRDRDNAMQLAPLPGVVLHPIDTDSHNVLEWLAAKDALGAILPPVDISHAR